MHEIKIYGEVIPFEDDFFSESGYVNLSSVQKQLKEAEGKDIKVRIKSFGGDVGTGFDIYTELRNYAKNNDAKVITYGESQLASIATVMFLAGDERILAGHSEPFVHNAWCYTEGDSKRLTRVAAELSECNNKIAQHYALHTDLSVEEALQLMEDETTISLDEAVKIRFATSIEEVLRPVALKRFNTNKLDTDMNKNKKTPGIMAKAEAFLKSVGLMAVNKLVMTADEKEVDFYELEEDEVVEVGANARIDGQDASGSYVMKSGETYVFEAGVLTEIIEASDETLSEYAVALQAEIDTLTAQLEQVVNASAKQIETLTAENAKKETIINNYKSIVSASAPKGGEKAKEKEVAKGKNNFSDAIAKLSTNKTK